MPGSHTDGDPVAQIAQAELPQPLGKQPPKIGNCGDCQIVAPLGAYPGWRSRTAHLLCARCGQRHTEVANLIAGQERLWRAQLWGLLAMLMVWAITAAIFLSSL